MEVVRKYVDASSLMTIMTLPETFRNRKLEVIVLPTEEQAVTSKNTFDIENVIQSLVGSVSHTDMSLSEIREERLQKYETID